MSRRLTRAGVLAFLVAGFWGTVIPSANAYIDPGAGSMIIQAVVGFFAALGAGAIVFREKVRGWFTRKPPAVGGDPNDE